MTIIMDRLEQGTIEWINARINCITMSNADKLLMKGRGGGESLTKLQYIIDVASEVVSGMPAEQIKVWQMQRGIILEPYARQAYEVVTGSTVKQVGLGYLNEDKRISASPDGLVIKKKKGMEIKSRGAKAHMRTIIDGYQPKINGPQVQGCMWVFELDSWDYCSFCPEFKAMPLWIHTVQRDEEMIKRIMDESFKAVVQVDKYVAQMRANPVYPGIAEICADAIETIEILQGVEQEIE